MKYFSMPADFKKETINLYDQLNQKYTDSKVIETYGNITIGNHFESGRSVNMLPEIDLEGLADFVHYSQQKNIGFNYTLNAPTLQNREFTEEGVLEIYRFLSKIYHAGIHSLTIALPSLIKIIKTTGLDFKIKTSTLCQVTNAAKALAYKKMGVERIVIDESINRDFQEIKRIRQVSGENLELIVNSICHKNCIYRVYHYNQIAIDSVREAGRVSADYYSHRCILQRYDNISNILRLSWIRPEDIKYYTDIGIQYFKLQGRHTVKKGNPARAVECYFKESFDGSLMELLDLFNPTSSFQVYIDNKKLDGFLKPFVETQGFCKNTCSTCGYCDRYARECINYPQAAEVIKLANDYYDEFDKLDKIIHSVVEYEKSNKKQTATHIKHDESEFSF